MDLKNNTEKNSCLERGIIFGAATSLEYFEAVKDQVKPGILSQYPAIVFNWLSDYYAENHKLPEDIYGLFQLKKAGLKKSATAHLVGKFLESLSDEYPAGRSFDTALMIPETRKYCETRRLQIAMERAQDQITAGDLAGAMGELQKVVKPVTISQEKLSPGYTGAEILQTTFSEPAWIIKDLLPQGFSPLCGPPKKGKSWFALNLAISIVTGEPFLGRFEVTQGSVLYLDFEQPETKIKERLKICLNGDQDRPGLENLYLQPKGSWTRIHQGGLEKLEDFVKDHPDLKLIIIDVWRKFSRPRKANEENSYGATYEDISPVKDFADKHNLCVLVIHHLSKGWRGYESPFEAFLGSTALAGASDNLFALVKGKSEADGVLWATGRDIEESQTALEFNRENCTWEYLGEAGQFDLTMDQNEIVHVLAEAGEPMSPKEIGEVIGKSAANISEKLFRMVKLDRVEKSGYGKYIVSRKGIDTTISPITTKSTNTPISPITSLNNHLENTVKPDNPLETYRTYRTDENTPISSNLPETHGPLDDPLNDPATYRTYRTYRSTLNDVGEAVKESFRSRDRV